jgi:hypothetical protein
MVVDAFYWGCATHNAQRQRLLEVLPTRYKVTVDEKAERFVGSTLDWDYTAGTVNLSMPGYIQRAI